MTTQQHPGPVGQQPPASAASVGVNRLAIVAFVSAFFCGPAGIVFGYTGLHQIKTRPQKGRGLAIAGTILGFLGTVTGVVAVVAGMLVAAVSVGHTAGTVASWAQDCVTVQDAQAALDDTIRTHVGAESVLPRDAAVALDTAADAFHTATRRVTAPQVKAAVQAVQTKLYILGDALHALQAHGSSGDPSWQDTVQTAADGFKQAETHLDNTCSIPDKPR